MKLFRDLLGHLALSLILNVRKLIIAGADSEQPVRDLVAQPVEHMTLQEVRFVIHELVNWQSVLQIQVEHVIVEHVEVKVDFAKAGNARSQQPVLGYRQQQSVVDVACEAKVHTAILD